MRIRSGGFGWHLEVLTLEPNEISFKSFMSDWTGVLLNDSPPTSLNGESLEIRDGSPRFEMDFLSISFLQSPRFLSWGQKMHAPPKKFRDDSEIFRNLQSFKQNRISRITNGDSPAETCPLNSRLYWALESALSRPSRTHAHCLKSNYPPRETPA